MRPFFTLLFCFFAFLSGEAVCQTVPVDEVKFFDDTSVLNVTLKTNIVNIFRQMDKEGAKFPALFSTTLSDGTAINEPVILEARGHFRKEHCYLPPLKIIFKNKKTSALKPLGSLKLVNQCKTSTNYQQYLVSEFLVYKMYNLITDKSFKVRLLNLKIVDTTGKKKTITENAFLMENEKRLAARNDCSKSKNGKIDYTKTNRSQMTLVYLFEYMIGNTDWSVSEGHNIEFIHSKNEPSSLPYPIPYDFDYSGFINTDYAKPDPGLPISSVQERLYRGFPRTPEEINEAIAVFKKQEKNIYAVISGCNLINSQTKKRLTNYLDGFFSLIRDPEEVNKTFIRAARRD